MLIKTRIGWGVFLTLLPCLVLAVPVIRPDKETIKDRDNFIPKRKHEAVPSKVVGVLVSDPQPILSLEGRSSAKNTICFSKDGHSYRWVYVPVKGKARIRNLRVPVGKDGKQRKMYPLLDMANAETIKQWNITEPFALVEIEVNDGLGSPKISSFVATNMKQLDGTKKYPLRVSDVVKDLQKKYELHQQAESKNIALAMTLAEKEALEGEKKTGPQKTENLMYITWLTDSQRLKVHFLTRITDGAYKYAEGPNIRPRPFPLPPKPGLPIKILPVQPPKQKPAPPAKQIKIQVIQIQGGKVKIQPAVPQGKKVPPAKQPGQIAPPPPPRFSKVRYGTTFGIEFGVAYEVDVTGNVVRTQELPIKSFKKKLPRPPFIRRPIDPIRGRPPIKAPIIK